jgi:hypothetical protein
MTCAMRYDEPRLVWTSLPITHEIHLRHIVVVVSIVLLQLVPSLNIKLFNSPRHQGVAPPCGQASSQVLN